MGGVLGLLQRLPQLPEQTPKRSAQLAARHQARPGSCLQRPRRLGLRGRDVGPGGRAKAKAHMPLAIETSHISVRRPSLDLAKGEGGAAHSGWGGFVGVFNPLRSSI